MDNITYAIIVGDFVVNEYDEEGNQTTIATYPSRCLSASFGGEGVASEVIPWEGTDYNPWDYKALFEIVEEETEEGETVERKVYTGEFVLEPITLAEVEETPSQLDRIEAQTMWTAIMTDTLLEV